MNSKINIVYPPEDLIVVEKSPVKEGVDCLVLASPTTDNEDYGFIAIKPLASTPEQLVWQQNTVTAETFVCGSGTLVIERANGLIETYHFSGENDSFKSVEVFFGDTMRWINVSSTECLFILETCTPPFQDERFTNLD